MSEDTKCVLWQRLMALSARQSELVLVGLFGTYGAYLPDGMGKWFPKEAAETETFLKRLNVIMTEEEKRQS